jgi:hypothetical protein
MRMAAPDRVETGFVHDMLAATQLQGDEAYFARLAHEAPATVQWIASHGVVFHQPTYYLAKGPPRIQPVGAAHRSSGSSRAASRRTLFSAWLCGGRSSTRVVRSAAFASARRGGYGPCGGARLRRLQGNRAMMRGISARAGRASAVGAMRSFQHRTALDGAGARRGYRRRVERHARRASRPRSTSSAPVILLIPTASW